MDLCNLEPPVSDVEALDMLHQTLNRIGGREDTMRSIWERAAKVKPQNLELQTRWFNYSSEGCDWKNAQKVSHSIDQNIPFILHLEFFYQGVGSIERSIRFADLFRFPKLGCYESPKQFPEEQELLLLGHIHVLSNNHRSRKLGNGPQTVWNTRIPHDLESGFDCPS